MRGSRSRVNRTRGPLRSLIIFSLPLVISGVTAPRAWSDTNPLTDRVHDRLRSRIKVLIAAGRIEVEGELVHASVVLPRFYERRGYRPAWITDTGPHESVDSFLVAIKAVNLEGLNRADYHFERIEEVLGSARTKVPCEQKTAAL